MIKFHIEGTIDILSDISPVKLVKKIVKQVAKHEKVKGTHYVSFIIVDNEEIQKINKAYRNIDNPTDVITFALIDSEEENVIPEELGDIFISYERVVSQAKDYGHSVLREFAFLVTHGMLHILGYDHQTKEEEQIMFGIQEEILNKLKIYR